MPEIKAQILNTAPAHDHILRRLAKAVIWQWDDLPADVQKRIQQQAVFMSDEFQTVQLNEQINMFIQEHKAKKI
jgi:hypothetical protein